MSTRSILFVFSRSLKELSTQLIDESLAALEPLNANPWALVSRDDEPDRSWEEHLAECALPDEAGGWIIHDPREFRIPRCPLSEVSQHYLSDELPLTADALGAKYRLHHEVYEQARSLPPSVRKDFDLGNCVFTFGYHDIFVPGDELAAPQFIARPLVSLHFWGYRAPNLDAFLPAVQELPAMRAIKGTLSELWGDVETALVPYFG